MYLKKKLSIIIFNIFKVAKDIKRTYPNNKNHLDLVSYSMLYLMKQALIGESMLSFITEEQPDYKDILRIPCVNVSSCKEKVLVSPVSKWLIELQKYLIKNNYVIKGEVCPLYIGHSILFPKEIIPSIKEVFREKIPDMFMYSCNSVSSLTLKEKETLLLSRDDIRNMEEYLKGVFCNSKITISLTQSNKNDRISKGGTLWE